MLFIEDVYLLVLKLVDVVDYITLCKIDKSNNSFIMKTKK